MNFEHYLAQATQSQPLAIDESWGQGRTTFGGLSAALLLHKITQQAQEDDCLRSLSVSFCGPLFTSVECQLNTQVLRAGKSVSHYQGQLLQEEQVVTQVTACLSKNRQSAIQVDSPPKTLGEAGAGQRLPYIKGITPEFTQHIDFSYVAGGFPFSNSKENHVHGWMRFKQAEGMLSNAHLVALIDAWPPAVIQKLRAPAPCATVTWQMNFVQPLAELATPLTADAWLWYEVEIVRTEHGYGHTQARIYTADGVLLVLSDQLVVAYA